MNDFLVLYSGMFCFGMIGLGVALTIYEFKKMARAHDSSVRDSVQKKPGLAMAGAPLKRAL
jgi:hypothetical protein